MVHLIHSILPKRKRPIHYVYPDVDVATAVNMMVEADIGALVVCDEDHILGLLSERDIVRILVQKGLSPKQTKVSEILRSDIDILKPTDSIERAMEMMIHTKHRHILVKDEEKLIAIISIGDLLFNLLEDRGKTIEALQQYINHH